MKVPQPVSVSEYKKLFCDVSKSYLPEITDPKLVGKILGGYLDLGVEISPVTYDMNSEAFVIEPSKRTRRPWKFYYEDSYIFDHNETRKEIHDRIMVNIGSIYYEEYKKYKQKGMAKIPALIYIPLEPEMLTQHDVGFIVQFMDIIFLNSVDTDYTTITK